MTGVRDRLEQSSVELHLWVCMFLQRCVDRCWSDCAVLLSSLRYLAGY
jgi:succinate dehydrogenase/fumarate reductase-like Fe-S protein